MNSGARNILLIELPPASILPTLIDAPQVVKDLYDFTFFSVNARLRANLSSWEQTLNNNKVFIHSLLSVFLNMN